MPAKKAKPASKPAKAAPAKPSAQQAKPVSAKPSSLGRLGDDVPTIAPKLSREPVTLLLAKSDVAGGKVHIRKSAPALLRIARGQVVHVKHAYRVQEHSDEREEYRFLLKTGLDGKPHPPSLARLGDQWGIPEDIAGYVQHEYKFTTSGRHTLTYELGSEYCIMGWGDTEVQALEREEAQGSVDVIVH